MNWVRRIVPLQWTCREAGCPRYVGYLVEERVVRVGVGNGRWVEVGRYCREHAEQAVDDKEHKDG